MAQAAFPVKPVMPAPGREEPIPEDLQALEPLVEELLAEANLWDDYIRRLSKLENPARGVFYAAELHEARQYRMALRYKLDFCKARIKRLKD